LGKAYTYLRMPESEEESSESSESGEDHKHSGNEEEGVPKLAQPKAPAPASAGPSGEAGTMVVVADPPEHKGEALPSLEPALSNIPPIHIKKTLMIVNKFIVDTTEFINKFAILCERKLATISQQTARLEIVTALLEKKLASIAWLGDGSVVLPAEGLAEVAIHVAAPGAPPPPPGPPGGGLGGPPPSAAEAAAAAPAAEPAPVAVGPPARQHPKYGKIFKMLSFGVPRAQLESKCAADGIDPVCLSWNPDEPVPAAYADEDSEESD